MDIGALHRCRRRHGVGAINFAMAVPSPGVFPCGRITAGKSVGYRGGADLLCLNFRQLPKLLSRC